VNDEVSTCLNLAEMSEQEETEMGQKLPVVLYIQLEHNGGS